MPELPYKPQGQGVVQHGERLPGKYLDELHEAVEEVQEKIEDEVKKYKNESSPDSIQEEPTDETLSLVEEPTTETPIADSIQEEQTQTVEVPNA